MKVNFVTLFSPDPEHTVAVYRMLCLDFRQERHGVAPLTM